MRSLSSFVRTQQPKLLIDFICIYLTAESCASRTFTMCLLNDSDGTHYCGSHAYALVCVQTPFNLLCEDAPHVYTYFSWICTHKFCIEIGARAHGKPNLTFTYICDPFAVCACEKHKKKTWVGTRYEYLCGARALLKALFMFSASDGVCVCGPQMPIPK